MKERLGVFVIAVLFTFAAGFVLQDPQTRRAGESGQQHQQENKPGADASDRDFVIKAAHGGKGEVEAGQLAVTKASNAEVKQFAQRLIDDHSKANSELMQLAQSKGISVPMSDAAAKAMKNEAKPVGDGSSADAANKWSDSNRPMSEDDKKMQSDHKAKMDKLNGLSGAEFDREYLRHMVMDHEKTVALFERQSKDGKDKELKAWAGKTLPTLQEHLRMARDLAGKVGVDSAAKKD